MFYDDDDQILVEHPFQCLDDDMSCNLTANSLEMIGKCFGVNPSQYLSSSVLDQHQWVRESTADWNWFVVPKGTNIDMKFFKILLLNGLFALPHGSVAQRLMDQFGDEAASNPVFKRKIEQYSHQIILCPNPTQRQVIDLREHNKLGAEHDEDLEQKMNRIFGPVQNGKEQTLGDEHKQSDNGSDGSKQGIRWGRNKKLKRYKKDFYLSVNFKFKDHLKICKSYHIEKEHRKAMGLVMGNLEINGNDKGDDASKGKEDGTWITDDFIDLLDHCQRSEGDQDVLKFVTFELWERESNEIVAASFGYLIGSILCDYTFMTLKRDHRSCGNILTKVIGDVLQSCGYDLWYWGFRLEYMTDYDKYGGKEIPRSEFDSVFQNSCSQQPQIINCHQQPVKDIVEHIKAGKAFVEPLPAWV